MAGPERSADFRCLDIEAAPLRAFIDDAHAAGERITPTHLVGRAVAHALAAVPELNVRIRHGRVIPRDSIDVFFITAVDRGNDLSGVKIESVDQRTAIDVARELAERSIRLKTGNDPQFARTKRLMNALPPSILRIALRAGTLVTQGLQRDVPQLGLVRSPFGSVMVSSVGMLGLPQGFAPLAWMYDVPLLGPSARSRRRRWSSTTIEWKRARCCRSARRSTIATPTASRSADCCVPFASTSPRPSDSSRR